MNCKHVQKMLPLYVGRDLDEKSQQLVKSHVESCTHCASSADEYRRTRQLLQKFAPPVFSEAGYTGIRQRVLREIERESTAPVLLQLVASRFRPRIRWAVATGLIIVVSIFAVYFISNLKNDRRHVADGSSAGSKGTQVTMAPSPSPSSEDKGPQLLNTRRNADRDMTIAGTVDHTKQSQRRKSSGKVADRRRSVAVNTAETWSMTAHRSPESNNRSEPDTIPTRDPDASEIPLRVEIQTKDPNVRIIWFSYQRTKHNSSRKSS